MEDFASAKDWLLTALLCGFGAYFGAQMKELVKSVSQLNVSVAQILGNLATHKERLQEHSERISKLEDRS